MYIYNEHHIHKQINKQYTQQQNNTTHMATNFSKVVVNMLSGSGPEKSAPIKIILSTANPAIPMVLKITDLIIFITFIFLNQNPLLSMPTRWVQTPRQQQSLIFLSF